MAEVHLDHPGDIRWYPGKGPLTPVGLCPHATCRHELMTTIAEGPDYDHYTLVQCDAECGGCCRAWFGEYPDGSPQRFRLFAFRQVRP